MRTLIVIVIALVAAARPADACIIDSTTEVAFGSYNVFSPTPLDVKGGVKYICILSLNIRIDLSTGGSNSYTTRQMTGPGGDKLGYNLYLDAARTRVWGNATGATEQYGPFIGLLVVTTLDVFGRVFAGQTNVRTGAYTDTITVTLSY